MNKNNSGTYIGISRKEEPYSDKWKEIVKAKIERHFNEINRSFSEEEYAEAIWSRSIVTITLSGIDFIVYIT